jgi:hypothetical protein
LAPIRRWGQHLPLFYYPLLRGLTTWLADCMTGVVDGELSQGTGRLLVRSR